MTQQHYIYRIDVPDKKRLDITYGHYEWQNINISTNITVLSVTKGVTSTYTCTSMFGTKNE